MAVNDSRWALFLRLYSNWGEAFNRGQNEVWGPLSEPWTDEQIEEGIRRCHADRSRTSHPKGWQDFAAYLPVAVTPRLTFTWGQEGGWFGDPSVIPDRELLRVIASMEAWLRPEQKRGIRHSELVAIGVSRGIDEDSVREAAALIRERKSVAFEAFLDGFVKEVRRVG